eukprot:6690581-Pyramimonas_sp.AAC.1
MAGYIDPVLKNVAHQSNEIHQLKRRQSDLEQSNVVLRKQIGEIREQLAMAEKALPATDLAKLAEYDREADPLLFSANCSSMVAKNA